ncbi:MAG: NTP transferase domain-containing protein, partial [Actinobacteria bacterium]|nr:NTP transferase domain-containing protein [Actinomycetota bacterium]
MRSALPKVLHRVAGRSLVEHVVESAAHLSPERVVVVVGHGREQVTAHIAEISPWVTTVVQEEQRGTGHAVRVTLDAIGAIDGGPVVVLTGDTPLLTGATLETLLAHHSATSAAATVLTAVLEDPTGYGRIVRSADGQVRQIVEHRDADEAVLAINEINSGMYAFDAVQLVTALAQVTSTNAQGEEYLTDVVAILRTSGARVEAIAASDPTEIMGVNDRVQLAEAGAFMRDRINAQWMRAGVTMLDPTSVWIDVDVDLASDVTLLPDTHLIGPTVIAEGAIVGPGTTLKACEVGEGATVRHTWAELAVIGP